MDVIKNCLITNSDAKILRQYCIDRNSPLYAEYRGFNTSVNLEATDVYNMYSGYVAIISGNTRFRYDVVVVLNTTQAIKYGNLKSIDVKLKQNVDTFQRIGYADKYVSVEYLSTYTYNQYSFRVEHIQMYKDDPMKILDVDSAVIQATSPLYADSGLIDVVDAYNGGIGPNARFILSNNEGS